MARLTRLLAVTRNAWLAWGAWRRETPAHLIGPPSDLGRLLEDGGYRRLETGGYRLLEDGTTGYPVEFLTADGNLFATADGIQFGVPA